MTEGQHTHDELLAEITALRAELATAVQGETAATQEAVQAAASAQQAAEVAVTEAAVTRADLDALRDELKAAIAEAQTAPATPEAPAGPTTPEPSGVPAAPADLPAPPAGEGLDEGAPQEAPAIEEKEKKNVPARKKKSTWWG